MQLVMCTGNIISIFWEWLVKMIVFVHKKNVWLSRASLHRIIEYADKFLRKLM